MMKNTLVGLAKTINAYLLIVESAKKEHTDARLQLAKSLLEAKELCVAKGQSFVTWASVNVKLSSSEVRKLVAVAGAKNPPKALSELRKSAAHRQSKTWAKRQKIVSVELYSKLETAKAAFLRLSSAEQWTFLSFAQTHLVEQTRPANGKAVNDVHA